MIYVDRDQLGRPAVLASPRAIDERARATKHFGERARGPKPKDAFKFTVYKDDEIKRHLHQLFRGKCAYCETRYVAVHPMDVEHFRPKSEVTDFNGGKALGYYWLASEWSNLLPSCIDCNRPRNYEDENGKPTLLGKSTLFPLEENTPRAVFGQSLDVEKPLLLDPCRDRPEQYLAFPEAVVQPAENPQHPVAVKRVEASVRVYGLNRPDLVQERWRVLLNLRRRLHQVRTLIVALNEMESVNVSDPSTVLERALGDLMSHEAEAIMRMADPGEPYSLMVRQEIDAFEAELGLGLASRD
jgi:uncharacterized protein (TIGR02646 family)